MIKTDVVRVFTIYKDFHRSKWGPGRFGGVTGFFVFSL